MRFSVRLLRRYVDADLPVPDLIELVTNLGLEVEEQLDLGMISGKVIVGQLLAIEPIAGADRIRLTKVDTGGPSPLTIVCGAQNIEVGQRVPVALFGMAFPDGMVLAPRRIRGIEGQGMLCSAKELGVAEDASGIWILPEDAPIGEPWDALLTIKVTANRPDALSYVGLARDIAAKLGKTVRMPDTAHTESSERAEAIARVSVPARSQCPRYTARVIDGVTIGPSPRWLQIALESSGLRPLNNVVDVTNWVMLELGHPLHGFDLDRLAERHIVVRLAKEGETLETLDGKKAELKPTDLLICDAEKPVALAGIMGGANSEIGDTTRNVLLESAYFHPATIRKTARRLGKKTDASYRFERGTDGHKLTLPLNRAAALIAQVSGGAVRKGFLDVRGDLADMPRITLRRARVQEMLGYEMPAREMENLLAALGFEIHRRDGESLGLEVPSHRPDISLEEDVIEEIARLVGYERIPAELPRLAPATEAPSDEERLASIAREALADAGLAQAINFSFVSEGANAIVGLADNRAIRLVNPIHPDQSVMRRSMVPSLLANLAHNLNHGVDDVRLFEVGHTYEWADDDAARTGTDLRDPRPRTREQLCAAAILCGGGKPNWREPAKAYDFFDIKGIAEMLLSRLGVARASVEAVTDAPLYHPGRCAAFLVKGERVALFGELHPSVQKELDLKKRPCLLEVALTPALPESGKGQRIAEMPRFPSSVRDLALVVGRGVAAQDIERTIRAAGRELLAGVTLFDVYEGDRIEAGKRSLAYSMTFRAPDRTLTDAEVTERVDAIVKAVTEKFGAALRA
jgi:phenylalanyl-tRNA synthetase beta chain